MIEFCNIPDLVMWAEEVASRPNLRDSVGSLSKKPGSGLHTRDEITDLALTVSAIISQSKPFSGYAMRCIYGKLDAEMICSLAIFIGSKIPVNGKTYDKIHRICEVAIAAEREKELFGRNLPHNQVAKYIGISRQRFNYPAWIDAYTDARAVVTALLSKCQRDCRDSLVDIGVLVADRNQISR